MQKTKTEIYSPKNSEKSITAEAPELQEFTKPYKAG
jgi:hypothetical protein